MQNLNLRTVFLVNSIVAFAFALGFLLGPEQLLKLFGLSAGTTESLAAQFFGTALVAVGLVTWFAKDFADQGARNAIATSIFFAALCGLVVAALGTLSKVIRTNSWVIILLYALFVGAYGYLQFFKRGSE